MPSGSIARRYFSFAELPKGGKIVNAYLVKADRDLFAVYQTMYSNADIEMWYDWNRRLKDTKWTDQCYFLMLDGKKIGGAIVTDEKILNPFIISPFCDRVQFWNLLLKHSPHKLIQGVLDIDSAILPMFGYIATSTFRLLCRPSDIIDISLPNGFICRPLDMDKDAAEYGRVYVESHTGKFLFEKYGGETHEEAIAEANRILGIYSAKNMSIVIVEKATNQIVAACTAGIAEYHALGFAEIADIVVLPQYNGRGIGKYMLGHIITQAYGTAPFVKLGAHMGNPSEYLYYQMGFIAGPRFTTMERCI